MLKKKIIIFLISLLLSFSFWLYVTVEQGPEVERIYKVNITYRNLTPGLTFLEPLGSAEIKVRGSRQRLMNLNENSFTAYVDLSGLSEGPHSVEILVEAPPFVKVVEVSPSRISVFLDKVVRVERNIRIEFIGSPKEGYVIEEPEINPDKITVEGPSKKIEAIRDVSVVVDITNIDSDVSISSIPRVKDALGNEIEGISITPSIVYITIKVKSILSSKVVPITPNFVGSVPSDYGIKSIVVSPSVITILGNINKLKDISFVETKEINITNLTSSKNITTEVIVPEGVEIKGSKSVTVQIVIERKIKKEFDVDISLEGKNENFNYILDIKTVTVEVFGFESIVKSIKKEDFLAQINVEGIGIGEYEVEVKVKCLNRNVKITGVYPDKVKLKVEKKEGGTP